ncbi:helix-turn-helix transcriptional regulator [Patescibacteria group bacterium]
MAGIDNRIRELRTERGLTQEDLADRVGVTRQTVIAIEKGGYVPSLDLAFRLAAEFGLGVEEVFTHKK